MKAESKFDIGSELLAVSEETIVKKFKVAEVAVFIDRDGVRVWYYDGNGGSYQENKCFATKEELLNQLGL